MQFVRHTNGVNYINAYGIKVLLRIFKVFESAGNRGFYGGQLGIRTLDRLPYTRVPGVRLRPLGQLSLKKERDCT